MSLDTVLKIGNALRNSPDSLKHFKYVSRCPTGKDGNYPFCISIPVLEDFRFDWKNSKIILSEVEKDKLVYMKFSTSDSDSSPKKYVFGDIYYRRESQFDKNKKFKKTIEYGGCFMLDKGNAFENSKKARDEIRSKFEINSIKSALSISDKEYLEPEVRSYIKKGDEFKMRTKYNNEKDLIIETGKKINTLLNNLSLFKFWNTFSENIEKISQLLKYAPAFEYTLVEQKNILEIFGNEALLHESYFKGLANNYVHKVSSILDKNETFENLSNGTKSKLLNYGFSEVFIHFDFQGKCWQELDNCFNLITDYLNSEISEKTSNGIVLTKSVYRTLCSGNDKNDWQFPLFDIDKRYQSFAFSEDTFSDFLYTDTFVKTPRYNLYGTGLSIFVLPNIIDDENETKQEEKASEYLRFLKNKDESRIFDYDPIFPFEDDDVPKTIKKFDFILADTSGKTISDFIEISGIDRSFFFKTKKEIETLERQVSKELKETLGRKDGAYISIEKAVKYLVGDVLDTEKTKSITIEEGKKYKAHILKVLPKIYTGNYHRDDRLLTGMIENIQSVIRKNEELTLWISPKKEDKKAIGVTQNWQKYQLLKHSFKLLTSIQTIDFMSKISESVNYQIGIKIGRLAKPLKKTINPFEKSYVGLLSRRVSTLNDCISFFNEIDEMLTRHNKTWAQNSAEARQMLARLSESDYDKELLAFGFFEGYFTYEVSDDKKKLLDKLERIISDYVGKDGFEKFLEPISTVVEEIKSEK